MWRRSQVLIVSQWPRHFGTRLSRGDGDGGYFFFKRFSRHIFVFGVFFFYFTHDTFARRTRALHDNLLQCIGARRSHLNNKLCNILLSPHAGRVRDKDAHAATLPHSRTSDRYIITV